MKKITVYSTTTCPYCKMLTRWLKEQKLEFTEYKVDLNPYAAQTMVQLSGQMGVPFTTIEDEDAKGNESKMHKVLGFDQPQLKHILGV
jgi:glutaredoxin 3